MDTVSGPITLRTATPQETASITDTGGAGQEPARNVAEAPPAGQPIVRLIAEAQAVDARSSQFQCTVRIENTGPRPLQIVSIRDFAPHGTAVQQVIDTSQSEARERRDNLYRELSVLMSGYLVQTSQEYRAKLADTILETLKAAYSPRGFAKLYYAIVSRGTRAVMRSLTENFRACQLTSVTPIEHSITTTNFSNLTSRILFPQSTRPSLTMSVNWSPILALRECR